MSKEAFYTEEPTTVVQKIELEPLYFSTVSQRRPAMSLVMPRSNILRYDHPSADTPFPPEYAFYLLGDFSGKTIVNLGCGDGLHTVVLASLGAKVISVDSSVRNLEVTAERCRANGVGHCITLLKSDDTMIPVEAGRADRVLCSANLHPDQCLVTARQIRRILKPGGVAVFLAPVTGPKWLGRIKNSLTTVQVNSISRAVGRCGRRREFMDSWILRHVSFARGLGFSLVWEALKEC